MSRRLKWVVLGCVWLSAVFIFSSLFQTNLSPDGALFGTWSRYIGTWRDPLLLTQPVDKPPLLFYLQAIFLPLFGAQQWTPLLPNVIASLLLIPLTAQLSWQLYRSEVGAGLTAVFLTLIPLHRYYATTALTDPLLIALLITSLLGISKKRYFFSGLFLGLALATKYQGFFYLPLVLLGVGSGEWEVGSGRVKRWVGGLSLPLGLLVLWQVARSDNLVAAQWANFGGIRIVHSWELWARLAEWSVLAWVCFGALVLIWTMSLFGHEGRNRPIRHLINLFILSYLLFHWLVAIPIWSRYLLLVAPLIVIQVANFVHTLPKKWGWLFASVLMLGWLINFPIQSPLPINYESDVSQLAEPLLSEPYGTVLYDNYYSWQVRYVLYDSGVFVAWMASPRELSADIRAHGTDGMRYMLLPNDARRLPWVRAIEEAGGSLSAVSHTNTLTLYQLQIRP